MGAWLGTERLYATTNVADHNDERSAQPPYKSIGIQVDEWSTVPPNKSKGIQVDVKERVSHEETQTPVLFTDRLSDYGEREVGSTEVFDHVCDICDQQGREAVGYCRHCQQYYCFTCCKGHEKMTHSHRHSIVGKTEFSGTNDDTLFTRQLVPTSVKSIPYEYSANYTIWKSYIRCVDFLESSEHTIALDKSAYKYSGYLKVIKKEGDTFKSSLGNEMINMIMCSQGKNLEVLLTVPGSREVRKCSIDKESTKPVTYFKTSGDCYGIAKFDNGYAVSVNVKMGYSLPEWHVQYLDGKGSIKKQILYDSQNKPLFSRPEYLASNKTQDTLYVSDAGKHAVIALDVCGNVLFTFTHSDMRNPMALTVDDENNAYVACGDNVVQIHKNGTKHRVLIQKEKNGPTILSVCFNPVSRALIVGEQSNEVKILNFV